MKIKLFIIVLLTVFSLPSVVALFHPGFFQSDDGEWMIIRFSAFHEAFRDGQIPVRFLTRLNHGYGYPVSNFLYPGFMYLAEPIHLFGFGFVNTIKIVVGLSIVGSAIFCFLWLSRLFDKLSSLIGSLFYLYTPYHLFDLYKRGSVGEILALCAIPFCLWQIERRSFFWSSIGITFLIISHNTLAVLFLGLIIVYVGFDIYVSKDQKELFKKYFLIIMLGIGTSAFFWIPAFFELQYTVFSETKVSNWQDYFLSINLIGFAPLFIFAVAIFLFIAKYVFKSGIFSNTTKYYTNVSFFFFLSGLLSLFLATSFSNFVWKLLPVTFIQFPFRFLSITILSAAFLSAFIVNQIKNSNKRVVTSLILLIALWFSAAPFLKPSEFFDKGEGFYSTNMDTTTVKNEYMPKWVEQKPIERFKEKVEIVEGQGEVGNLFYNSKKITFDILAKENIKVRVNTIYYPGWNAIVYPLSCHPDPSSDGKGSHGILRFAQNDNKCVGTITIDYSNKKGVMELRVPKGESKVELKFSETPLRLFANILSLASFIALIFFVIVFSPKRPKIKARNIEVAKLIHL